MSEPSQETPSAQTPSLDSLLARLVDETISRDELLDLERRLEQDPEAQRRYLHYLDLHAELAERIKEADAEAEPPRRRPPFPVLAVAIGGLLLLAGLLLWQARPKADRVRIADTDGQVQWIGAGGKAKAPEAGLTLPPGTLETLSPDSWISFRFPDDTTVSMAGRARLGIWNEDGKDVLHLERGTISVKASPRSPERMLRVVTPTAEAEVLGTQFNVKAGDDTTRIVVNEGRVRVTRIADGQIEDVEADEVLVAALEQDSTFKAVPREAFVQRWESVLPQDLLQGQYEPATESNSAGARATPHLWKGEPGRPVKPILLYTTVFDPSPKRAAPLRLSKEAKLQVQGRLTEKKARIHIGFATHAPNAGLLGKYSMLSPVEADEKGHFTLDLDLSAFVPKTKHIPASPAGQEVAHLWIQTARVDAGLLVERVRWGP